MGPLIIGGAPEETTFCKQQVSNACEALKPAGKTGRKDASSTRNPNLGAIEMSHETVENIAGALAGLAALACMTLLFAALSAPVVETVQKFLAA
ncbi:MAG: hypothetical protein ACT443_02070 [Gemmatimonadota bacterium]